MTSTNDDDLRRRAERRVASRNGFQIHLLVYVLVNILLWSIWAYSGGNVAPWPIFATLGWGIGVLVHGWVVYGNTDEHREAQIQAEMERMRKGRG